MKWNKFGKKRLIKYKESKNTFKKKQKSNKKNVKDNFN